MWKQLCEAISGSWGQLIWMALAAWALALITFRPSGRKWLSDQFEWFKLFFYDDETHPGGPSHKNLILLTLTATFIVTFMRKLAYTAGSDLPDIPQTWAMVLLAGLGIMAAKSGASKYVEGKFGNGNGNGKNGNGAKPPEDNPKV